MKLSQNDNASLSNLLSVCAVGGIDQLIIEDGLARGMDASRNFVLISDNDIPKLTQKMGLARLSSLKQRLDIFASSQNVVIDAKESERGEITSLEISSGRNKAQFRCTSTTLIKAPKSINDTPAYSVELSKDEVQMALGAIKTMGAKSIALIIDRGVVSFVAKDATNDAFTVSVEAAAKSLEDTDSQVIYYHAEVFAATLRRATESNAVLQIGIQGTLTTTIDGHGVTLLPKVETEEE